MIAPSADESGALAEVLDQLGATVRRNVSLAPMCTYKVGGSAAGYVDVVDVATLEAVHAALEGADRASVPVLFLGRGSNLLVSDRGFPGLVLRLGPAFDEVTLDVDAQRVIAGGRCAVARRCEEISGSRSGRVRVGSRSAGVDRWCGQDECRRSWR